MDAREETRADVGITGRTRLLGLLADPVVQARSPAMANALLAEQGRFGEFVLVPLEVAAAGLADVTRALRRVGSFAGAVVSMPHKTAIVPLLDDLTPEARLVGAVNVIRRTPDARLVGTVLDGEGFVAGLRAAGHDVAGKRCLLVGAGGAGSAVAVALAQHGCAALAIVNRTPATAATLAARVRAVARGVAVTVGDDAGARWDLAVNATSLGMRPDDPPPMSDDVLRRTALVAECVLAPETTALLARARALGCAVHGGVAMLAAQMPLLLRFMGVDGGR
jgi:shikimate dehydrogenase